MTRWRTHEERPDTDELVASLVAVRDDEGGALLVGIFLWRGGRWESEDTRRPLAESEYWWMPEAELVAPICASRPTPRASPSRSDA